MPEDLNYATMLGSMARKRRSTSKRYSLSLLLAKQPKSLAKHPMYLRMLQFYGFSPRLKSLRFNRRCYSLLDRAVIAPENLENFYRTYRLPKDPFFPLFFMVKREYQEHRAELKRRRESYILKRVRELDSQILRFLRYLGKIEQKLNAAGRTPVWEKTVYPDSKKKADEYHLYNMDQWIQVFTSFGEELKTRYPHKTGSANWHQVFAAFILECPPEKGDFRPPDAALVRRQYRRLSKLHHPDSGGNPERFCQLKQARDLLSDSAKQ
ncbi:DnaJ domain-containing protein [Marispirochaeta sp.]|uniref:DnaJ domain-containing protein n=1 Tax=Marispirochaeta sp. TaxID=2038653 RepID=UPI0029C755AC|nr:DnaJ domain-containing protein [Marispirochaeta sp.]